MDFAAAVIAGLSFGCSGSADPVTARIVEGEATIHSGLDSEQIEGSFVVEITRPAGDADPASVVLLQPSVQEMVDGVSAFWPTQAQTDVTDPVEVAPGATARVRVTFSGERPSALPPEGWLRACSEVTAPGTTTSLVVSGSVADEASEDFAQIPYTAEIEFERQGESPSFAPAPSIIGAAWSHRFGAAGEETLLSVASDALGNALITGEGGGGTDADGLEVPLGPFVAKISEQGNRLWTRTLPVPALVAAGATTTMLGGTLFESIELDGTTVPWAGGADVFVARMADDGTLAWTRSFGDRGNQTLSRMVVAADGSIVISGHDNSGADFGGGPFPTTGDYGVFVVKLDANGDHVFSQHYGQLGPLETAVDASGSVVIAATLVGVIDLGGGPIGVSGTTTPIVAKFDPLGGFMWNSPLYVAGEVAEIGVDGEGNVFIASYYGEVVKHDASGAPIWLRTPFAAASPTPSYVSLASLAVDESGRVLVVGGLARASVALPNGSLNPDAADVSFVAELDGEGFATGGGVTGCSSDLGSLVAARPGPLDRFVVAGMFRSFASFDGGALESAGGTDVFVAAIDP
jgi:hypothetical protein